MEITKEENQKLQLVKQIFKVQELTKEQVEFTLGRKLTDKSWEVSQRRNIKDNFYSIKHLFHKPEERLKPQFTFADVAKHTAKKARRQHLRKQDNDFRVAKLFRDNKSSYRIEKVREYNYNKFNPTRAEYKIYGEVDIFQMYTVLQELIDRMTSGLPENVKLQISLENDRNDRISQTKLLNKADMISKLADWVILFIDYYDMKPEDLTFKLLTIQIPTGSGKRVNRIITVDSKRSIIQIRNKDTTCLARAIVVGLAVRNKEKLQEIFTGNLTEKELKQINKTRQSKSKIGEGIFSDNEVNYI